MFSQYFVDYKLSETPHDTSEYVTNFLPYLGYASQIPNVFFNWVNIFFQFGSVYMTNFSLCQFALKTVRIEINNRLPFDLILRVEILVFELVKF